MILLKVLFELWGATLRPTEFKIFTYLCCIAAATPDRKINRSIKEIAKATGLAWRTVQAKLHELATLGVIEILSTGKERMLIQIPLQHWSSPTSNPKRMFEKSHAGTSRLSMSRVAAMSSRVSDVCTRYS